MGDMRYQPEETVRFLFEGNECTGVVELHQPISGFVLLRSTDTGHQWAVLQAVRESYVWRPGEEPPVQAQVILEASLPEESAAQEPTAS